VERASRVSQGGAGGDSSAVNSIPAHASSLVAEKEREGSGSGGIGASGSGSGGGGGVGANSAAMELNSVAIIAIWYGANIGVLLLNKYLLSVYGFKYPVFLTLCHMVSCTCCAYATAALQIVNRQYVRSQKQMGKIALLAVVFCASVVGGNISLRFIPVSFNQAIGATTPLFTALFSALLLSQRETTETYLTLVPVVVGIVLASGSEPLFNLTGFIACFSATGARALKTVLQGILLSSDGEKLDSMNLLLYMSPVAVLALLPATFFLEPKALDKATELAQDNPGFVVLLLINSLIAFLVNLSNFLVTKTTSPLTLQVLGNAKGAVAVVVSVLLFRNPVTMNGMVGYTITVLGVIGYSESKKRAAKAKRTAQGNPR